MQENNPMQDGNKRCGAKTRAGGECKNWAMPNGRCRMHGGKTPKGIASPNWKHGRYAKYLPTNLLGRYQTEANDPEMLALSDEIALVRSRLSFLLEKIEGMPDAGSSWRDLRKAFARFERAQRDANRLDEGRERERKVAEAAEALEMVRMIIRRGVAEWAAWGEIVDLTDQVRRLTASEQKRRIEGENILYIQDVMALFQYTVNLINEHVSDPTEKSRLSEGLYRFSSRVDGSEAKLGREN